MTHIGQKQTFTEHMTELPDELHERIKVLCAKGDALLKDAAYEDAIAIYNQAWALVPHPVIDWNASTWILAAIGDACFLGGFHQSGIEALEYALQCPDGFGNPFIHLRLGQCAYEKGSEELAAENLARAYMLEGKEIFAVDSPKYFDYLKTKIAPPASGVW
jgi:tetratricopeptide (TPR) repeat protein